MKENLNEFKKGNKNQQTPNKETKKEYLEILGLKEDAKPEDIKKQYRTLAKKYHPDKAKAENKKEYTQKFIEISEAYQNLKTLMKFN
ncbi:MAG: DnaJ domain-containing protein [Bacteroidetes bacterium]|nr:DnaJ domain-containing protein [Bacteroidota bacterium]